MIKENMELAEKSAYIEVLRILSSLAVISIHVSAAIITYYEVRSISWDMVVIAGSLLRWCIPLFLIITGVVFLGYKENVSTAEMARVFLPRIIVGILLFGVFYYFLDLWTYEQMISIKSLVLLPIAIINGRTGYHLWYLYLIAIIYLLLPALKIYVDNASRMVQKQLIVVILVLNGILSSINNIICLIPFMNDVVSIYFVLPDLIGYIGCVLIGSYISKYEISSKSRNVLKIVAFLSVIIMPLGNLSLSIFTGQYQLELSSYTGVFSISIALALFFWIKRYEVFWESGKKKYVVLQIGACTYGIYLNHVMFVNIFFHKLSIDFSNWNVGVLFIFGISIVSLGSLAITTVLKKIPLVKNVV